MIDNIQDIERLIEKYQSFADSAKVESEAKETYETNNSHAAKVLRNSEAYENPSKYTSQPTKPDNQNNGPRIFIHTENQLSASEAALFVINEYKKAGTPISNVGIQQILYLLWLDYYNKTEEFLFDDYFRAWPIGPVLYPVNYAFIELSQKEFDENALASVHQKVYFEFLRNSLREYSKLKPEDISAYICYPSGAWAKAYSIDSLNPEPIPFDTMISLDCKYHKENRDKLLALGEKRAAENKAENDQLYILRISGYIKKYYANHGKSLDAEHLDYLMYLLWIEYYEKTSKELFYPEFYLIGGRPRLSILYKQDKYIDKNACVISYGVASTFDKQTEDIVLAILSETLKISKEELSEYFKRRDGACYCWHQHGCWKTEPIETSLIVEKEINALKAAPVRKKRKERKKSNISPEISDIQQIKHMQELTNKLMKLAKWQENWTKLEIMKQLAKGADFSESTGEVKNMVSEITKNWKPGMVSREVINYVSNQLETLEYQPDIFINDNGCLVLGAKRGIETMEWTFADFAVGKIYKQTDCIIALNRTIIKETIIDLGRTNINNGLVKVVSTISLFMKNGSSVFAAYNSR